MLQYLSNIKVSQKLATMIIASVIGSLCLLFISGNTLKNNLIAEREARLYAVVDSALSQINVLYKTLPEAEAQEKAKEVIRAIRYDGDNYVFVMNEDRIVLVNPVQPQLDGQQLGNANVAEDRVWFDMVNLARGGQSGSVTYPWKDSAGIPADKLSIVKGFAPWGWVVGSGMIINDIEASIFNQVLRMGIAALSIVAVMIVLGVIITRAITHPLDEINHAMEFIARGDLTAEIPVKGKDEIGVVAKRINESVASVRSALADSVQGSKNVALAASQIASSAEETSHAVSAQQDQLSQLATAMNEMSATVAEVAHHAEDTARDTHQANREAGMGDKDVHSSVDCIKSLSSELHNASEQVAKLKEGVMEIGDVTAVISGISEQTNLLALNAAIEAARAGDQGRGFAVVADEVRSLASRTNDSTNEIQNTINHLQTLAISTFEAMEKSQNLAGSSVDLAEKAGSDLDMIVSHIQHVSDKATQIATAAEEQSSVAEDMNRNVNGINDSAIEMSQAAVYLARESETLAALSRELDEKLVSFKLA
ncbi:methyl-accepting chemotaxis protein [Vibrio intestinalis]|uniref:methyl-accepting chemotaxis protein n=1 Tax=Vibrio intestinalis TaxID=2933291 RepID=UPI0021A60E0E|nr:methyl-accepting chemotaxis protein [Vibrio intestinalis]